MRHRLKPSCQNKNKNLTGSSEFMLKSLLPAIFLVEVIIRGTAKPVLSDQSKVNTAMVGNGILMQVESTAECSRLTYIKRVSVLKAYFWSFFDWLLKTGFTVDTSCNMASVTMLIQ